MDYLAAMLSYLGISPPDMFAGFCGSIANVAGGGTKPGKIIITMLASTLTANYLGVVASTYIGIPAVGHVGSFLVGFGGLYAVRKIIESKAPGFFNSDNAGAANGKPG